MWLAAKALPWRGIMLVLAFLLPWGATYWQAHQRGKAEDALTVANARVAALEAAGRAQERQAALTEQAWLNVTERLSKDADARIQAIYSDRDSLARRLFEYADRARSREVPGAAPGAGGDDAALGDGGSVSTVAAATDDLARRARRCDAVEAFWQSYAASVGVPVT